jgi:hypothetical protein
MQKERVWLEDWGSRAGLQGNEQPVDRLNWKYIHMVLEQQRALLTSCEHLRKTYHLNVEEEEVRDDEDLECEKPRSGLERCLSALRPDLYTHTARAIRTANNPLKRLRWAVVGRDKVVRVTDELANLNDELERMLDAKDSMWLQSSMAAILRELLSRSTNETEVADILKLLRPTRSAEEEAIQAAAEFKRIRLVLNIDKREDEDSPPLDAKTAQSLPSLRNLQAAKLKSYPRNAVGLHLAKYRNKSVLVEWRIATGPSFGDLRPHIEKLAVLLSNPRSLLANLQCMGLVCEVERARFALVYDVPCAGDSDQNAIHSCHTLRSLVDSRVKTSLRDRLAIACKTAEAVLQLHTAGWLHKGIRTENVVFVNKDDERPDMIAQNDPYLVGYGHARPVSTPSLTQKVEVSLSTTLYLHPLQRSRTSNTFRKAFDLYGLATVLLEIALWEPLVSILARQTGEDWVTRIANAENDEEDLELPSLIEHSESSTFVREVTHSVGPAFLEAIQLCLKEDDLVKEEGFDVSVHTQQQIVEKLRSCNV